MSEMMQAAKITRRRVMRVLGTIVAMVWRASPGAIIVQAIGAVASAILPLATTYFAALTTTALAEAYVSGESRYLLWYVIITVTLGVMTGLWGMVQAYFEQVLRYRVETVVNDNMFARLHGLDFWRYDDPATIDMFDKAQRFTRSFPHIFSQSINVVTQLVSLVVGIWIVASVSAWLGLLLCVAIVPSGVIQFRLSRLQSDHWRKNVNTRRRMHWIEYIVSRPEHIAEMRLYGTIRYLLRERAKLRDKDRLKLIAYERRFMGKRLLGEALQAAAEVIALVWVTLEIVAHRQPLGQFVLMQQMISRVLRSVDSLISTYNTIDEDLANITEYQRFMELPLADKKTTAAVELRQELYIDKVHFRYFGAEKLVLRGVSLRIKRGQHVAIVGENGAGKTTLVKLLTGLYTPSSGRILLDGHDLSTMNMAGWHRQLAVLGQNFIHYDFATAYENVWYGDVSRPVDQARIVTALQQAEAEKFVKKLPKGGNTYVDKWMDTDEGDKGVDLSGGQWQRLALARNFYRDTPIIILDEPTSAIDAAAEARIFAHLFRQKTKTIITISHRLSTVKKADRIFFMKEGKVVEQGGIC